MNVRHPEGEDKVGNFEKFVVRSCRTDAVESERKPEGSTKNVEWENATVVGSDCEETQGRVAVAG